MKTTPLILAITAAAISMAQAEPEKTKGYELKNRSAFHVQEDARIPFWPLGFVRPPKGFVATPVSKTAKVQLDPSQFNLTSILLGNPPLATINGHAFGEGEYLPVLYGNDRLRVVLRSIRDGGVTLDYDGQQIFVGMKRPEIAPKQSQQQQPQSDEFFIRIGPTFGK